MMDEDQEDQQIYAESLAAVLSEPTTPEEWVWTLDRWHPTEKCWLPIGIYSSAVEAYAAKEEALAESFAPTLRVTHRSPMDLAGSQAEWGF